jgi:hypothetical protein
LDADRLWLVAFGNSVFALFDGIDEELAGGTSALVEALAGDCGARVGRSGLVRRRTR